MENLQFEKKNILIITEANEDFKALEKYNYKILYNNDYQDVSFLKNSEIIIDIIIFDCNFEANSNYVFLKEISKISNTPIILLSKEISAELIETVSEFGFFDFVKKTNNFIKIIDNKINKIFEIIDRKTALYKSDILKKEEIINESGIKTPLFFKLV